jgi:hypothetical protein
VSAYVLAQRSAPQHQPRHTVPLSSPHKINQNRTSVKSQDAWPHTPKPGAAQSAPARSGVGLDQPSFVYRITLNESLFSTSLRSLGGPTLTPALTPSKPSRCGPCVRQSVLCHLAIAGIWKTGAGSIYQARPRRPRSPCRRKQQERQIVAGHGTLGSSTASALEGGQRYLGVELTAEGWRKENGSWSLSIRPYTGRTLSAHSFRFLANKQPPDSRRRCCVRGACRTR